MPSRMARQSGRLTPQCGPRDVRLRAKLRLAEQDSLMGRSLRDLAGQPLGQVAQSFQLDDLRIVPRLP